MADLTRLSYKIFSNASRSKKAFNVKTKRENALVILAQRNNLNAISVLKARSLKSLVVVQVILNGGRHLKETETRLLLEEALEPFSKDLFRSHRKILEGITDTVRTPRIFGGALALLGISRAMLVTA